MPAARSTVKCFDVALNDRSICSAIAATDASRCFFKNATIASRRLFANALSVLSRSFISPGMSRLRLARSAKLNPSAPSYVHRLHGYSIPHHLLNLLGWNHSREWETQEHKNVPAPSHRLIRPFARMRDVNYLCKLFIRVAWITISAIAQFENQLHDANNQRHAINQNHRRGHE